MISLFRSVVGWGHNQNRSVFCYSKLLSANKIINASGKEVSQPGNAADEAILSLRFYVKLKLIDRVKKVMLFAKDGEAIGSNITFKPLDADPGGLYIHEIINGEFRFTESF